MRGQNGTNPITLREHEVLTLLVDGFTAKEIAAKLCIAPRTVECHIDHLRTKTGSRNRAHMAAHAVRTGLVLTSISPEGSGSGEPSEVQPIPGRAGIWLAPATELRTNPRDTTKTGVRTSV